MTNVATSSRFYCARVIVVVRSGSHGFNVGCNEITRGLCHVPPRQAPYARAYLVSNRPSVSCCIKHLLATAGYGNRSHGCE